MKENLRYQFIEPEDLRVSRTRAEPSRARARVRQKKASTILESSSIKQAHFDACLFVFCFSYACCTRKIFHLLATGAVLEGMAVNFFLWVESGVGKIRSVR